MRRERLIRPTVRSRRLDKTRQASHPASAPPGGCGVNALSALHVRSRRLDRRDKRRIRHLHRATGGCGVKPYPPYMCNPPGRIGPGKRRTGVTTGRILFESHHKPRTPLSLFSGDG